MPIAAVRRQATRATLTDEIVKAPIWALTSERALPTLGQTIVLYHDDGTGLLASDPAGVTVDIGVLVEGPFVGDRLLRCVMTPGGRAVHVRHQGGYDALPGVHDRIRGWCQANDRVLDGFYWEHYTHWHEETDRRITDVYHLLA